MLTFLCRLILAAVFGAAAFSKWRDTPRLRASLREFGAPDRAISMLAAALPLAEMVAAVLLLIEPFDIWGAWAAIALLALFTTAIAVALWRGRRPACACFGSLSQTPIGAGALLRNGLLTACAVAIIALPDGGAPVLNDGTVTGVALALAVACLLLSWFSIQLWRQQGRLLLRIERLEVRPDGAAPDAIPGNEQRVSVPDLAGKPLPLISFAGLDGRRIDNASLRGMRTILIFTDTECQHCRPLLARLATWKPDAAVIAVFAGQAPERLQLTTGVRAALDEDGSVMRGLGILGTPAAIAIDADGVVTQAPARGLAAVSRLLDSHAAPITRQGAGHELATV